MGLSKNSIPSVPYPKCAQMQRETQIPYYAPDGTSFGFRSLEAARCLIEGGYVKPSYGPKRHLRAIWLRQEDGSSPVPAQAPSGTRYSFPETLDSGRRCWKHRRLNRRDEDGTLVITRGIFLQVVAECLVL